MNKTLWDFFVDEYSKKTLMPRKMIEYIAVYDILNLCVEGFSNNYIKKKLELPVKYISDILVIYLDFFGWDRDLDFSPIALYKDCDSFLDFEQRVFQISSLIENRDYINLAYNICVKFYSIKEYLKENGWSK